MSSVRGRQRLAAERRSLAARPDYSPAMCAQILELNAQGDAAKSIRMALGSSAPSLRKIYQVIAEAKAMHDPQPVKRRPAKVPGQVAAPLPKPVRPVGEPLAGWWFAVETVVVTRLGFGSVDCLRVPVSVSGVARKEVRIKPEGAGCVLRVSRSLAEAMAQHPLAGLSGLSGGQSPTEPSQPHPRQ